MIKACSRCRDNHNTPSQSLVVTPPRSILKTHKQSPPKHSITLPLSETTVVFRPTVRSLVTLGYEWNRSGACHGSHGRSNRVTLYPKKESLSKKKFSAARPTYYKLYTITNLHLLPRLDGCATTSHYTTHSYVELFAPVQLLSLAEQFC